jgi:hypothetical protein
LLEAGLFGLDAMLHTGVEIGIGSITLSEPVFLPAVVVEGAIAIGLLLAVVLPGRGGLRAGRVLAAQAFAVVGVLAGQLAGAYDVGPDTRSNALLYVLLLALSFASMFLIAWPRAPLRPGETATPTARADGPARKQRLRETAVGV